MLTIDGAVTRPLEMHYDDLRAILGPGRVEDVSSLEPSRTGAAVRLDALLEQAGVRPEATHVTLHSSDGFAASVPLDAVRHHGLLLFQQKGEPLGTEQGGPVRFLVPNAAACGTAELDACANVKHVCRVELTAGAGRDTRRPS